MGSLCSSLSNKQTVNPVQHGPTSALNARIIQALHIKRDENVGNKITFEK